MKNNQNKRLNERSTIKVLFALAGVYRNERNEIQSITFSDLRGNKIHFNTVQYLKPMIEDGAKYLEIEILDEVYQKALNSNGNFIFDLRDIIQARKIEEIELTREIKTAFELVLSKHNAETSLPTNKITAKMILRKRETNQREARDLAFNNRVRYENADGICVDLNTNASYYNNPTLEDPNFIEVLVDVSRYLFSVKENRERFPHNFFHKFDPKAIKRKDGISFNSELVNQYFEILRRREFGENSVFMGLQETMEAVKLRESSQEVAPVYQPTEEIQEPAMTNQPSQEAGEVELNRYQIAQRARREREKSAREKSARETKEVQIRLPVQPAQITLPISEYENLVRAMQEVEFLRNANIYNQELSARLEALIIENKALRDQNEGLKEIIRKASENLAIDIRKLI